VCSCHAIRRFGVPVGEHRGVVRGRRPAGSAGGDAPSTREARGPAGALPPHLDALLEHLVASDDRPGVGLAPALGHDQVSEVLGEADVARLQRAEFTDPPSPSPRAPRIGSAESTMAAAIDSPWRSRPSGSSRVTACSPWALSSSEMVIEMVKESGSSSSSSSPNEASSSR